MGKDYFEEVYLRRLNKDGEDLQSRVHNKRKRHFESLLLKSVYRVDFKYEGRDNPGIFTRMRQGDSQTLHYLLVRESLNLPSGTILMIPNKDDIPKPWMIYYLDEIQASGYNRYITLKMTHYIEWTSMDKKRTGKSWAYMYGQEDNMLKDEIMGRSRSSTIYTENLKLSFLVMPLNGDMQKGDYFEMGEGNLKEGYTVTGYDRQSQPGVQYVSADPLPLQNLEDPTPPAEDGSDGDDYYWLIGGE